MLPRCREIKIAVFLYHYIKLEDSCCHLHTQEYAEKNTKLMANRGILVQGSIPREDAAALMKRTRSVSTFAWHVCVRNVSTRFRDEFRVACQVGHPLDSGESCC